MSRGRNLLRGQEWDMALAKFTSPEIIMRLWPSWAAGQGRPYEWGWGMHPMWGVWGIGMMVMMLMFWGVVIAGIVVAIRWMVSHGGALRPSDHALEILRQRYARGDISKEEFEAKKQDLS